MNKIIGGVVTSPYMCSKLHETENTPKEYKDLWGSSL